MNVAVGLLQMYYDVAVRSNQRNLKDMRKAVWATFLTKHQQTAVHINPYPTAFLYGNGTVLHFYQQQGSSTTKTVHKVINRGLKAYL